MCHHVVSTSSQTRGYLDCDIVHGRLLGAQGPWAFYNSRPKAHYNAIYVNITLSGQNMYIIRDKMGHAKSVQGLNIFCFLRQD